MVNNIQNIDFENPSDEVIFDLCMGNLQILFGKYEDPSVDIDKVAHRDLLVKYDLQSFSDLLVNYMGKWFQRKDSMQRLKTQVFDKFKEDLQYELKISKIVKMFIDPKGVEKNNLEVSFTDLYNKITVGETDIINQIKEVFIKEIERLKLNETELTREEAFEELVKYEDIEWLFDNTDGKFFDGMRIYPDLIPENIIEDYMICHFKLREITNELVDDLIRIFEFNIKLRKSKVGAKIKNMHIGELARRLSYLHSIRLFINQDKITSIKGFPLSNKTCLFIYLYFDFWNLLYDHINYGSSRKENRVSYVKALIRNNEDLSKKGIVEYVRGYTVIDVNIHARIDLFRKAHQKEITPEEFQEKISPFLDNTDT